MQAFNQMTANLQIQILRLDANGESSSKQLNLAIINSQELLQATRTIAKALNSNALMDFLNANIVILQQLQQVITTGNENNPLLTKSAAITQQIATMYQDAIVPMLSRLHNLSTESENMQKITAITSLGNEIITYSAQMNQFSEKFKLQEKIIALFGIILLLSSISMMVAILSRPNIEIPMLSALTTMALGCNVCAKAMQLHAQDPSTDLIITSVKKMEPLIIEIAKNYPQELDAVKALLSPAGVKVAVTNMQPTPKTTAPKPAVTPVDEPAPAPEAAEVDSGVKFMDKIKGVLDIFNTKK